VTGHSFSLADAGDGNGDGLPDLVLGDMLERTNGAYPPAGVAYVLFGRRSSGDVDLSALGGLVDGGSSPADNRPRHLIGGSRGEVL
jgi:hypothetical protein